MINVNESAQLDRNNLNTSEHKKAGIIVSFVFLIIGVFVFAILQAYFKIMINMIDQGIIFSNFETRNKYSLLYLVFTAFYWIDFIAMFVVMIVYTSKIKNTKAKSQYHLVLLICLTVFFPFICSIIWISLYPKAEKLARECPETIFKNDVKKSDNISHKNISNNIGQSVNQKLSKLESLRSRGLVDDEDYNRIKNDILNSEFK